MIGSFVSGSKTLYNFVDKNNELTLLPSSYVNDPYVIGQNYKMISINTAVEIDLTGQVCSESIGHTRATHDSNCAPTISRKTIFSGKKRRIYLTKIPGEFKQKLSEY